jgi:hypothetical protein
MRTTGILGVTDGKGGRMFLMWIAGAWLGANVAVVALLVALSERGRRRDTALPPGTVG